MRKHSHQEIQQKLAHADALTRAGRSQVEVCKTLGVSVMTLHRWRKLDLSGHDAGAAKTRPAEPAHSGGPSTVADMHRVLEELTEENRRLRKIVTDLLLDKMRVEEAAASTQGAEQTVK